MLSFKTDRFSLRRIDPQVENLTNYLSWLRDTQNSFISGINPTMTLMELKEYIFAKNLETNCLLLGIYVNTNFHIGNIKAEPIDTVNRTCWIGILIGEKKWRGKGVAQETISALTKTLNKDLQINKFYLGVDRDNSAAIRAYTKMGFRWESDKTMSLELKDLIKTIDI